MSARRLAIVLSTAPVRRDMVPAAALACAARTAGIEVQVFFMHEGVAAAAHAPAALDRMHEDGCDLIACASSADEQGGDALPDYVMLGSQDDHASVVGRADRLVAFT